MTTDTELGTVQPSGRQNSNRRISRTIESDEDDEAKSIASEDSLMEELVSKQKKKKKATSSIAKKKKGTLDTTANLPKTSRKPSTSSLPPSAINSSSNSPSKSASSVKQQALPKEITHASAPDANDGVVASSTVPEALSKASAPTKPAVSVRSDKGAPLKELPHKTVKYTKKSSAQATSDERSGCQLAAKRAIKTIVPVEISDEGFASGSGISGEARPTLPEKDNTGIFKDWSESNKQKSRGKPEFARATGPDMFGTLSERRRFEKLGQRDRLPEPDFDPSQPVRIERNPSPDTSMADVTTAALEIGSFAPRASGHLSTRTTSMQSGTGAKKVPQTCYHWSTPGETCSKGPDNCPFHHAEGYERSDPTGYVPPKYFNPPWACWYWWNTRCRQSAKECNFAHENWGKVGPLPGTGKTEATIVELSEVPLSQRSTIREARPDQRAINPPVPATKSTDELTCYYWWHSRCSKSPLDCPFAHHTTGVVAPKPGTTEPEYVGTKSRPPPSPAALTCPYWFSGKCFKPSDQCKFAHYNTGWVAVKKGENHQKTRPVDLSEGPKPDSDALHAKNKPVCKYWLSGNCRKSSCGYTHPVDDATLGHSDRAEQAG